MLKLISSLLMFYFSCNKVQLDLLVLSQFLVQSYLMSQSSAIVGFSSDQRTISRSSTYLDLNRNKFRFYLVTNSHSLSLEKNEVFILILIKYVFCFIINEPPCKDFNQRRNNADTDTGYGADPILMYIYSLTFTSTVSKY